MRGRHLFHIIIAVQNCAADRIVGKADPDPCCDLRSKSLVKPSDNGLDKHWENFISAVKSRKMDDLNCPIQAGAHVATVAQMGIIAYRSGKKLEWNEVEHAFNDHAINKQYLMKEYHNGYKLPKI